MSAPLVSKKGLALLEQAAPRFLPAIRAAAAAAEAAEPLSGVTCRLGSREVARIDEIRHTAGGLSRSAVLRLLVVEGIKAFDLEKAVALKEGDQ